MIDPSLVHGLLRYCHILLGSIGLVAFWIPVVVRKGSWLHVACGTVFAWCAYAVVATALVSCAWALADPWSFARSLARGSSESFQLSQADAERMRFFFAILAALALAVLQAVVLGRQVIRSRAAPERLGRWWVRTVVALSGGAGLALAAFGAGNLPAGPLYAIPLAVGILLAVDALVQHRYLQRPRPTPMTWWYKHMEYMLGAGVAFHTAFLVFGFSRVVGPLPGGWAIVPWLLPAAIGVPATSFWVRYYRRKFER